MDSIISAASWNVRGRTGLGLALVVHAKLNWNSYRLSPLIWNTTPENSAREGIYFIALQLNY
jgi:hypothetical protein